MVNVIVNINVSQQITYWGTYYMSKKLNTVLAFGVAASLWLGGHAASAANNSAADDYLIVNKAYNKLAFYQDKKLVAVYPVATGKTKALTPEGKFKVVNKVMNRPYYSGNIKGGDPKNPLGPRWMGFSVPGSLGNRTGNVYGIHGTNNPSSIGTYASGGCIRMNNSNVIALYPKVLNNTPVFITSSSKSFDSLTNDLGYIKPAAKTTAAVSTAVKSITGTHVGAEDPHTFEVKTAKGYMSFQTTTSWYIQNLKPGGKYTYFYQTNKYGQNVITNVNK